MKTKKLVKGIECYYAGHCDNNIRCLITTIPSGRAVASGEFLAAHGTAQRVLEGRDVGPEQPDQWTATPHQPFRTLLSQSFSVLNDPCI